LLAWDKDRYTERFLALFPYTCVLQPKLIHLYQTSSLLPSHLPIVASTSLRLLYSLLYSVHIKHFQVLDFLRRLNDRVLSYQDPYSNIYHSARSQFPTIK
jgi:hypothetical protein